MSDIAELLVEQLKTFYKKYQIEKIDDETISVDADRFSMMLAIESSEKAIREYSRVKFIDNELDGNVNDVYANNSRLKTAIEESEDLFDDFVTSCIYAYDYDDEDF